MQSVGAGAAGRPDAGGGAGAGAVAAGDAGRTCRGSGRRSRRAEGAVRGPRVPGAPAGAGRVLDRRSGGKSGGAPAECRAAAGAGALRSLAPEA